MFDEKSSRWIRIYRLVAITVSWIFVISGLVSAYCCWYFDGIFGIGDSWFVIVSLAICGFVVGYIHLVINMLVIQFLNNVQIIRQKIEKE